MFPFLTLIFVLVTEFQRVAGQQFTDSLQLVNFTAFPGLGDKCIEALNRTVACPSILGRAGPGSLLNTNDLSQLCASGCRSSLADLKLVAQAACAAKGDIMVNRRIAFPATYLIDKYIYSYDISCYKDRSSGQYCDKLIGQWRNETVNSNSTNNHDCHDCILGAIKVQVEAPVAYSHGLEKKLNSATSKCQATGYAYTTPGPYALNSTTRSVIPTPTTTGPLPAPTQDCVDGSVIAAAKDTCDSIATAHNVSTFGLLSLNNLDMYCGNIKAVKSLCLPKQCPTYRLGHGDSCYGIAAANNITTDQLSWWNNNLGDCINMDRWVNWNICVGPPGGTAAHPPTPTDSAAPVPTNAAPESNKKCKLWHNVVSGDTCGQMCADANTPLEDFYFLNPSIDKKCSNIFLGVSYCVQPVGDINTYPGHTATGPSTTFTRPATATTTKYTPPARTQFPRASGSRNDCLTYQNYRDTSKMSQIGTGFVIHDLNNCTTVARKWNIGVTKLLEWNPSLSKDDKCALQPGLSYCVGFAEPTATVTHTNYPGSTSSSISATSTSPPETSTISAPAAPSPTQPGAVADCKKWHKVVSGDGCWSIANDARISLDDFYKWNPGVGNDCSKLWLNYYVCIGA